MSALRIREDFAGAGGGSLGKRLAGLDCSMTVGVEVNPIFASTALKVGHRRLVADVTSDEVRHAGWGDLDGYTSGSPRQPFSQAGKGEGLRGLEQLASAAERVALYGALPENAVFDYSKLDARSVLSLEPLLVAHRHRPTWMVLEQVPTAMPAWRAFAPVLEMLDYDVVVDFMNSEQYGVPQARQRAVLIARLDSRARIPVPTHSKYYRRAPERLDPGVRPWVTLAQALGGVPPTAVPGDASWVSRRPSPTIVGSYAPDVVAAPAWRKPGDGPRQKAPGSVRVTVSQAGVLQSFPADYPWQGTKGQQYQQVGNAVPPLMAAAIIREVTS